MFAGALAVALVAGAGVTLVTAQQPLPAPQVAPPRAREPRTVRHPYMQAAARDLERATRDLEKAAHDYDGHRARALELVKQAEQEVQEALTWAEAHPEAFKPAEKK
jgi:hypothetical protein